MLVQDYVKGAKCNKFTVLNYQMTMMSSKIKVEILASPTTILQSVCSPEMYVLGCNVFWSV